MVNIDDNSDNLRPNQYPLGAQGNIYLLLAFGTRNIFHFSEAVVPPEPEAEKHAVEEILEDIFVHDIKELGVMLNDHGYKCNTQYIK